MILAVCPNPSVDTFVWIESFEPGKVNRAIKEKRFPGGKGVHVALACAEMDEEVTLLGFWGGETGTWIKTECENRNIICHGPELKEWSRSCFTFKSNNKYDDTELLGTGPTISTKEYNDFISTFNQIVDKSDVITLSGSWPIGSPTEGYAELIQSAKKNNKPVILDATGAWFKMGLLEKPYAIHLNFSESKSYTELSEIRDIIKYFRNYIELVAITSGEDGLYLGYENSILHGNVTLEKVYSSVGSGDCLTAGLALGLKNKIKVGEMLKLGVACGAANCLREDLGMFYRHDVEKLSVRIQINESYW